MDEISNLLQFIRDKSTKKLHSDKFKEKTAAKAGSAESAAQGKKARPVKAQKGGYNGDEASISSAHYATFLADMTHDGSQAGMQAHMK